MINTAIAFLSQNSARMALAQYTICYRRQSRSNLGGHYSFKNRIAKTRRRGARHGTALSVCQPRERNIRLLRRQRILLSARAGGGATLLPTHAAAGAAGADAADTDSRVRSDHPARYSI